MSRHRFPVSVKAAIFNDENDLLMIFMDNRGDYGLPGGHIDEGEQPDDAIRRELDEETGVQDYTLRRADFFLHEEGKLVLAYTGATSSHFLKSSQDNQEGVPVWISKDKFNSVEVNRCFADFIKSIWI